MFGDIDAAAREQGRAVRLLIADSYADPVFDAAAIIGEQCATCDGYMCMDCAEGAEHARCTRPCPDCLIESIDWDESLEGSVIVSELRGLHALDRAVNDFDSGGESGR